MAVLVTIRGIVHGVGYRAWVLEQAERLEIRGWVRNHQDGSVEAWLEGDASVIAGFVRSCHDGPRFAEVTAVSTDDRPDEGFDKFEIIRS